MRTVPLLALAACIPELPTLEDPCAPFPDPGLYRVHEERPDSRTRKPYVYVPDGAGPRDLVVLLHGAGMSGPKMAELSGFLELADREGFVLVYPNGLGWPIRDWNAGPAFDPSGDGADDVAFLDALVRDVSPKVCGARVLATGFSNGAMMGHRWACQGDTVDVLAVSSGPLMVETCDGPPLPVRHYHGTDDTVVPPDGGRGDSLRDVSYKSVNQTMDVWKERNGCADADPTVTTDGDTTCTAWGCQAPTEQCLIDGWAHAWPGGINSARTDADATGAIWDFFQASAPPLE